MWLVRQLGQLGGYHPQVTFLLPHTQVTTFKSLLLFVSEKPYNFADMPTGKVGSAKIKTKRAIPKIF